MSKRLIERLEQRRLLSVSALAIDIGPNTMDLPASNFGDGNGLAEVTSLVSQGYNNGDWQGQGLSSSSAANDPTQCGILNKNRIFYLRCLQDCRNN